MSNNVLGFMTKAEAMSILTSICNELGISEPVRTRGAIVNGVKSLKHELHRMKVKK